MQKHLWLAACLAAAWSDSAFAQMTLPGKFEVTDTGSASYTIPIQVVPGTAGLEPKLSLQYDSRSGNGLLGVGWSLSGLPSITRCGKTIAQDGQAGGVAYDANDRFCLDGQRLIAINGGIYGADQTEYRTERESFSKIVSYGTAGSGPAHFKVWTKAGLVMEFGNTADSRIEAQGKPSVRVWAINRTSDTKSNYFTVSYIEDNTNGEYRPDRIDYTGNSNTGTSPNNSVRFVYETRPDIVPLYQGGSMIKTTQRTMKIEAWQSDNRIREYRITYGASPNIDTSRAIEVTTCSGLNFCLPARNFRYSDISSSITVLTNVAAADGLMQGYKPLLYDFNRDGRTDLLWDAIHSSGRSVGSNTQKLWLSNGDGTTDIVASPAGAIPTIDDQRPLPGDFNGDGRGDVLWYESDAYQRSVNSHRRNLWLGQSDNTFLVDVNPNGANGTLDAFKPLLGDFNGDGRTDVLWYEADGYGRAVYLRRRSLWLGQSNGAFLIDNNPGGANGTLDAFMPLLGDFNGDGRTDVLWYEAESNGRAVYLRRRSLWLGQSNGTFMIVANPSGADGTLDAHVPYLGDFNGDGKTDVLWVLSYSSWLAYGGNAQVVWLGGEANNFQIISNVGGGVPVQSEGHPEFADFNGDGITDVLWYPSDIHRRSQYSNVRHLWIGKGDGAFNVISNIASPEGTLADHRPYLHDFNGDGKSDVIWVHTDGYNRTQVYRKLWLSRGDGSFQIMNNMAGADGTLNKSLPYFGDYNGDGRTDILWDFANGYGQSDAPVQRSLWIYGADQPSAVSALVAVSGVGETSLQVAYRALSQAANLHAKDTGASACTYPCVDISGPLYVVSEVKSSNGLGGEYRSTYRYVGAKSDQHGRGFLGFRQMIVKDEQTGVEQVTSYRQDYPFTGLVASREKKLGTTLLNRSTNSYSATDLGGTRRYPFLTMSLEESWELNGSALPSVTTSYQYDAFGNATQVSVSTGDGHGKVTVNTYQNDAATWHLGRLTRSEVTSTAPGN